MNTEKKLSYIEYKEQRQREFDELPKFFAFSTRQFIEGMKKLGVKDERELYALGNGDLGGFYRKVDEPLFEAYYESNMLQELLKDPAFAEDAFYYEMSNHEYHINPIQGNWDVISCFASVEYSDNDEDVNEYFKQLDWSEETKQAYLNARTRYLDDMNSKTEA
jgi:hypothetical protein